MVQFDRDVIEKYDQLKGKQRQKVAEMYRRVNLIGKIISRTGFVLLLIIFLERKSFEKQFPFLSDATVEGYLALFFGVLIGMILLLVLVTESMQAYYSSKYPYYTRKVGRYAAYMERIHSNARRK